MTTQVTAGNKEGLRGSYADILGRVDENLGHGGIVGKVTQSPY